MKDLEIVIPNKASYFNATDTYIELPTDLAPSVGDTDRTIIVWASIPPQPSGSFGYHNDLIRGKGSDLSISTTGAYNNNGRLNHFAYAYNSGNTWQCSYDAWSVNEIGNWFMIAGTWKHDSSIPRSYVSAYINRVKKESWTKDAYFKEGTGSFRIGTGSGGPIKASVYEVQIYNRTLSDSEIKAVYAGKIFSNNLIAWYKFPFEGTTLEDLSGNDKDGTANGNFTTDDVTIKCYCSRWDQEDHSLIIETYLDPGYRRLLRENIRPGAVSELYTLLGRPVYYDTSFGNNTLIIRPVSGTQLANMHSEKVIYVKNYTEGITEAGDFRIKIIGYISGSIV